MKLYLLFAAMLLLVYFTGDYVLTVQHEHAHVKVCEYLGGEGSQEVYFDNLQFKGVASCNVWSEEKAFFDGIIEGFGYQVQALHLILFFNTLFLLTAISVNEWKKK
ncbi:MAG: hypothetical protein ACE5DI_06330 [Candidatus Micrarchaeia archaeon]